MLLYPLDLRVLAVPGQTRVEARQVLDTIKTGYGYAVFLYDKRAKQWAKQGIPGLAEHDIYMHALSQSILQTQQDGKLSLIPVKPFAPKGMEMDFKTADRLVHQLLAHIPSWKDNRLKQPFGQVLEQRAP